MIFSNERTKETLRKLKETNTKMILCIILARYSHIQWLIKTKKQIKIKRQLIMTIYGRKTKLKEQSN